MAIDGFCGCCNPTDIALLADGRVVTAEKGLPRVKVMNPDGTLSCVVAPPDGLSAGASGTDLAVGPDGRVYVLDPQVQLVRIFAESRP
jgi:sugar lactone lactonase YvrE